MKYSKLILALIAAVGLLSACERTVVTPVPASSTTVPVPVPVPVAVPGSPGPQGPQGSPGPEGAKGEPGKGGNTVVIVPPDRK